MSVCMPESIEKGLDAIVILSTFQFADRGGGNDRLHSIHDLSKIMKCVRQDRLEPLSPAHATN